MPLNETAVDKPSFRFVELFSKNHTACLSTVLFFDSGIGGLISWDRNSTFSGGWIFDHEVEIPNND